MMLQRMKEPTPVTEMIAHSGPARALKHRWMVACSAAGAGIDESVAAIERFAHSVSSLLPALGASRHRAGVAMRRVSLGVMLSAPLSVNAKRHRTMDFVGHLTLEYYRHLQEDMGQRQAEAAVAQSMAVVGRRWMADISRDTRFKQDHMEPEQGLGVACDALSIPSNVRRVGDDVVVTSNACPYLRMARESSVPAETMCHVLCGEQASLFKGLSEGTGANVAYRAESMMGHGDPLCVKRVSANVAAFAAAP